MDAPLPHTIPVTIDTIPETLREGTQFVGWRWVWKGDHYTKVPLDLTDISRAGVDLPNAAVNKPKTWTTAARAHAYYIQHGRNAPDGPDFLAPQPIDGIGRVFTKRDGLVGVDIDKCRDPETGAIEPWAWAIVALFDSYTEATPSGTGLRVYVKGVLPPGRRSGAWETGKVEMYGEGRYFTLTGCHVAGTPVSVEERQDALAALHRQVFGEPQPTIATPRERPAGEPSSREDAEVLERARTAANGAAFVALFDRGDTGGHNGDASGADLALCNLLRFWTGGDPAQMDRLFRLSALMRPKWDEKRGETTYGERTITKALPGEVYTPSASVIFPSPVDPTTASNGHGAPDARDEIIAVQAARIAALEATVAAQHKVIAGAVAVLEADMTTEAKVIQMGLAFRQHHGFGVRRAAIDEDTGEVDVVGELKAFYVHQPSEAERLHVSPDAIQTVMNAATEAGAAFTKRCESLKASPWTSEPLEQPHKYVAYVPAHDELGETLLAIAANVPDCLRKRKRRPRAQPEPQETMGVPPPAPLCHDCDDQTDRRTERADVARCRTCRTATQAVLIGDGTVLRPIAARSGRGSPPPRVAIGLSTAVASGRGDGEPPQGRCGACRTPLRGDGSCAVCTYARSAAATAGGGA